jgi:hypothetical protein
MRKTATKSRGHTERHAITMGSPSKPPQTTGTLIDIFISYTRTDEDIAKNPRDGAQGFAELASRQSFFWTNTAPNTHI